MPLKQFQTIATDEPKLERIQQNITKALQPIIQASIIDGVHLTGVVLTTGQANLVAHKLGRPPLGWLIVRKRATADIWDEQDGNSMPTSSLDLRSSATVTVDLWVF